MSEDNPYKSVYVAALNELGRLTGELESLDERREAVDKRIADVKKGILALAPLCDEAPWAKYPLLFPELTTTISSVGLTAAVRQVLSRLPTDWMTPVAIRNALKDVGYEGKSTNILPSIHTVLKRLIDAREVETDARDGRTWYRWKTGAEQSSMDQTRLREFVKRGSKNVKGGK